MGSAPAHGQFLVDRESPLFTTVYRDAGTWLVHETAPSLDHSAWQELRSRPREASVSPQLDAPRVPPTNAHLVTNHTRLVGIECLGLCSARLGPIPSGLARSAPVIIQSIIGCPRRHIGGTRDEWGYWAVCPREVAGDRAQPIQLRARCQISQTAIAGASRRALSVAVGSSDSWV